MLTASRPSSRKSSTAAWTIASASRSRATRPATQPSSIMVVAAASGPVDLQAEHLVHGLVGEALEELGVAPLEHDGQLPEREDPVPVEVLEVAARSRRPSGRRGRPSRGGGPRRTGARRPSRAVTRPPGRGGRSRTTPRSTSGSPADAISQSTTASSRTGRSGRTARCRACSRRGTAPGAARAAGWSTASRRGRAPRGAPGRRRSRAGRATCRSGGRGSPRRGRGRRARSPASRRRGSAPGRRSAPRGPARAARAPRPSRSGMLGRTGHPVDPLHHVEGRPEDLGVVAGDDRSGDAHVPALDRRRGCGTPAARRGPGRELACRGARRSTQRSPPRSRAKISQEPPPCIGVDGERRGGRRGVVEERAPSDAASSGSTASPRPLTAAPPRRAARPTSPRPPGPGSGCARWASPPPACSP